MILVPYVLVVDTAMPDLRKVSTTLCNAVSGRSGSRSLINCFGGADGLGWAYEHSI